jgi:hypothetical protein
MKHRQPTPIHLLPRALAALPAVLATAIMIAGCLLFQPPSLAQDQVEPASTAPPDVAEILKNGHYQTEIPGAKTDDGKMEWSSPDTSSSGTPPRLPNIPPIGVGATTAAHVGPVVIYALIAALAILVLAAIFMAYRGSGRRTAPEVAQAISTPITPQAPRPVILDRIEELAAAGDFEAAIHLMLLRALVTLRTRLGELPDSLTSREILRRSNLPRDAAKPLSVIIGAVEVSHFGGQSPNEAVYRLCIDHYRQFLGSAA